MRERKFERVTNHVIEKADKKGRYISQVVYSELKRVKHCQRCKLKLKGLPQIHHRIPVRYGGVV